MSLHLRAVIAGVLAVCLFILATPSHALPGATRSAVRSENADSELADGLFAQLLTSAARDVDRYYGYDAGDDVADEDEDEDEDEAVYSDQHGPASDELQQMHTQKRVSSWIFGVLKEAAKALWNQLGKGSSTSRRASPARKTPKRGYRLNGRQNLNVNRLKQLVVHTLKKRPELLKDIAAFLKNMSARNSDMLQQLVEYAVKKRPELLKEAVAFLKSLSAKLNIPLGSRREASLESFDRNQVRPPWRRPRPEPTATPLNDKNGRFKGMPAKPNGMDPAVFANWAKLAKEAAAKARSMRANWRHDRPLRSDESTSTF